ncbi:MAG TPA: acido-empty-quinoprotein group A [Candidatus Acidoferrum sp.]|nr:acido-empty-quinoprotein group A [Candidatus Acidoferrum sp.]
MISRSAIRKALYALTFFFCVLTFTSRASAQGLDPAALLKPPTDAWPTYNGDYSGRRFSTLDQINAANVNSLTLAWIFRTPTHTLKSTPLVVNGTMYFTSPDHVWAIDAKFGRQIWHYQRKSEGDHIGNRGVAMYKDWLYFESPDAHLICLNAKDGTVRWDVVLADAKLGYFATMAPLVVKNHIIAGVSGDVTDVPGFLLAIDPDTGAVQWRWNTEPKPGEPGSETWPKDSDAISHGGGMTWMTGTYDPNLNLLYWGTGNPNPVLAGEGRPGDNLFTCTIVALDADTGKLVWHFQPSPHDVHDWDAVQTPVLFDAEFKGKPRKLLAQASRNGFYFLLDRTSGEHLATAAFIEQTWASGIDAKGRPIAKPSANPAPDGTLVEPGSDGSTNWMAPSFDPQTNLFYVNARRLFSVYYNTVTTKAEGWGGRDRILWANSTIRALDFKTGKVVWNHEIGEGESIAGILTTAGHLLFTADTSHNLLALDPTTGKTLWHLNVGGPLLASPMTYMLDGRQFLIIPISDTLYAFALPEKPGN